MMAVDEQKKARGWQVSCVRHRVGGITMRVALSLASLILILPGAFAQKLATPSITGVRYTSKGEVVAAMVFPVMGGARWADTKGKARDTESLKYLGLNIPAPKMRPLLACFDGVWTGRGINGDNGCVATYGNINNDTPGTDDGLGGDEYAYAPGIWPGARVRAGQHVAYCGDSGDAEATGPRLHFELSVPGHGSIDPSASLRAATILQKPLYPLVRPEVKPTFGQLRVDGQVVSVDTPRGVAAVRVAAWIKAKNKITAQTRPEERWVRLAASSVRDQLRQVEQGDFIAVVGKDPGHGQAIVAKQILPLQINKAARQLRAAMPNASSGSISHEPVSTAVATQAPQATPGGTIQTAAVEPIADEPEYTPPPAPEMPRVQVLADFESGYYQGWETIGNCWGQTLEGANTANNGVRGWGGLYFLTSARPMPGSRNLTSGTGRARSTSFLIPEDASEIRFLIAGGNYPYRCCLNLLEGEQILRTATGENPYKMKTVIWDVSDLRGKVVRLEIRDSLTVGIHAYVHVDDIVLLCGSTEHLSKDIPYPKINPNPSSSPSSPKPAPLPKYAPFPPGSFSGGGGVVPSYGGG